MAQPVQRSDAGIVIKPDARGMIVTEQDTEMRNIRRIAANRPDRKTDPLCREDRLIWERVVRCVRPLSVLRDVKTCSRQESFAAATMRQRHPAVSAAGMSASLRSSEARPPNGFDRAVYCKIARGRLHIESRVDLHGLIQQEAYRLLLHFLRSCRQRGQRHVLVITGKGTSRGGDGILRQAVPRWLAAAPFHSHVTACEPAAHCHGGPGAFYVRLRRQLPGRVP